MKGSEHLSQELQQRLRQSLNPQSVALGRVLAMTVPEFEEEVRRELDENPALELQDKDAATLANDYDESSEQLQLADYGDPDDVPVYLRRAANHSADDEHYDAAAMAADDSTDMGEVLLRRLADDGDLQSPIDFKIAANIIGNLDDNGYMTRSLPAIADDMAINDGIDVDDADVRRVFEAVRALDPAGIGAVDLRDCLLLQLRRMKPTVESLTAIEIIDNYYELFSRMHFERLEASLGIDRLALEKALALIRSLNPKPASVLSTGSSADRSMHVSPDFIVDYDSTADSFNIQLAGNIPELSIEESFRTDQDLPTRRYGRDEALAFIKKKRDEARSFIKLVDMRAATLMSIAKSIVRRQRDFLISGDRSDIKPMVLKDVSADTGYDISVISRGTAGKYMLTPHGLYPVKMLFNERPDGDSDISSHHILEKLSAYISTEDKRHPLSDRELTEMLAAEGYDIARRTVAKYRERLGMPVARLRKLS